MGRSMGLEGKVSGCFNSASTSGRPVQRKPSDHAGCPVTLAGNLHHRQMMTAKGSDLECPSCGSV